ncbi:FAH family protein [Cooperia oncophora]
MYSIFEFPFQTSNAFVQEGNPIITPPGCENLHQEVELGVVIGKTAKNIPRSEAMSYVGGYTVALDMTARDFQDEAKKGGAPWYLAKSFDTSCPVSDFIPKEEIEDPHTEELFCRINGVEKQRSRTDMMIFDIPTLIEYTTRYVTLEEGDVLLTGTPAGVCRVLPGDTIEFGLEGRIATKFVVQ